MDESESLSACPFCGYTMSPYDAVAVVGIHDKDRSCILHGFKVLGYDGPKAWNRRAGAGRASHNNGGKQLCSSAWLDALVKSVESAVQEWHRDPASGELETCMEWLEVRLNAFRRHAEAHLTWELRDETKPNRATIHTMKCRKCKTLLELEYNYCPGCGDNLCPEAEASGKDRSSPVTGSVSSEPVCTHCGEPSESWHTPQTDAVVGNTYHVSATAVVKLCRRLEHLNYDRVHEAAKYARQLQDALVAQKTQNGEVSHRSGPVAT